MNTNDSLSSNEILTVATKNFISIVLDAVYLVNT